MSKKKSSKQKKGKKKGLAKKKPAKVIEELTLLPDPRAIEGIISGGEKGGSLDQAQDLMYEAWDTADPERRVVLALKALEISPDCADAYVLLAAEVATSPEEATELYRKGVEAGERAIGERAFQEDVGYFWGILETRPYMRARCGLAQCLWKAGQREEAVEHYRKMLHLNPNDNQGIRYLLAPCLLEFGRDEELAGLLHQYEGDISADWVYTEALLSFRKEGDKEGSRKKLTEAVKTNPHVPSYLLKKKKMPRRLPHYTGFGDESEAIGYVHLNSNAWKKTPGAIEWLAAHTE